MNLALKNTGCKQECQRTITTANKTTINVNTLRYKETELHNKTLKKKVSKTMTAGLCCHLQQAN